METTRKLRLKWQNPFSATVFVYREQPDSINDILWVQHLDVGKYLWQCRADIKTIEGTASTMEEAMCAAEDAYDQYLAEQEKHIRTEREKLSEPKPVLGTITPVPKFKPGDRVVRIAEPRSNPKRMTGTVTVANWNGDLAVVDDDGYVNPTNQLNHWELAKKDDAKISLKSGPLEGRTVWSKDFGFGVIYWDDFYSCYKVRRKIGTDGDEDEVYERSFLKPQFELIGDDPVESKSDDRIDATYNIRVQWKKLPEENEVELVGDDDRIDVLEKKIAEAESRIVALEKRVAELEKKANPQKYENQPKSEEAIIREFVEYMIKDGWCGTIRSDTEKYIKEVLNK